ncbi:MAG: 16S rRNA (cytosine(967)-C(5))-methyltransferase RsmB [Candidatus Rokubacteria bacterium]|nr:16S rRNA (cytosine(967)-C(5))-methyltransferase RsmB [Candidatus Rokubacteria bacterium]
MTRATTAVSRARVEALRILCRVEEDRAFADLALEAALERARLPARDRALTTELVYGTLRWQRRLDWILAPHCRRKLERLDPWVRNLLRLTAYQLQFLYKVPAWAAVNEAVALAKHRGHGAAAPFINAVLRSLAREGGASPPLPDDPVEAVATRLAFPSWLARRWVHRLGVDQAERLMMALDERPPATVRVNLLRCSPDGLARRLLEEEEVSSSPTSFAPDGLVLEDPGPAFKFKTFKEGWFTVQDEASILIGHLLAPRPGETVADVCAAPGTKTTHLAELMENRGRLIAMDPHAARLKLVPKAAHRLGVGIVECHVGRAEALAPKFEGRCDRVLVDAPCSNLGVIRRHADVKWRCGEVALKPLAANQRQILEAAAAMVKPGGILVYATCSLEPEENEEVVLPFLAGHPEWRLAPPENFPIEPEPSGVLRCLPHRHGTDGFTAFRLRAG